MKSKVLTGLLLSLGLMACGSQRTPTTVEAIANPADLNSSTNNGLVELDPLHLIPADSHSSKIIGNSSLVPVQVDGSNVDANLRPLLDAFGLMSIGNSGACSATHLGHGYVITAGHCFLGENPGNLSSSNAACANIKVYWGYRGSPATGNPKPAVSLVSQCTKLIYAERSDQKDFAVFQVDKAPSAQVSISSDGQRAAPGTKLTIFGYPQARPLEWSQYCPLTGTAGASLGFKGNAVFTYQCDTEPGNSGSTVLGISASGIKIVGIHDGAAPSGIDSNYATSIFDIRQTLLQKGFNLDQALGLR